MTNLNGQLVTATSIALEANRGFLYGDAVFETLKVLDDKVLFLEDHYFRLMSSLRILRMEIPMNFTMEHFESEVLKTIQACTEVAVSNSYRVRFTVFRSGQGFYLPKTNEVEYLVTASPLQDSVYKISEDRYEVELFKDFYVPKQLLSTLKTTNKLLQVVGSVFAEENNYANCLVLNDEKNVIEALQANLFVVKDKVIKTPPLSDGCVKGIMRKQLIELIQKTERYEVVEESVSPFELQKADEIFLTNCIIGIQPISNYRKKSFATEVSSDLLNRLNAKIRLS